MKKITILLLWISLSANAQVLSDVTGNMEQMTFAFSAWGDFDNDGDLDVYYAGELDANNNGGGLYENDNGTFTLLMDANNVGVIPAFNTGAADAGDFNGDGNIDFVIMGADMSYMGHADIYINNGDGTFTAMGSPLPDSYMGDVKFFDSDGDGDLDVLITGFDNSYSFYTKLFINDNGTLTENTNNAFPALNYGRIAIADYDNDGDLDFSLNGLNDATSNFYTKIWKNEGANIFTEQDFGLAQLWLGDMEWGDIDNDGDLDFVYGGTLGSDSEIHLMINDNGNFTEDTNFAVTPVHRGFGIELADFDLDAYLDIFVVGTHYDSATNTDEKIAKIFINDRDGGFAEDTHNSLPGVEFCESQAIDYDNDGKTDLFYTGMDLNGFALTKLYHNDTIAGMEEDMVEQFEIYPNPVYNVLHITPETTGVYQVEIMDITGKTVYQQEVSTALDIDFSGYNQGIYLLKVTENDKSFVQKLIHK